MVPSHRIEGSLKTGTLYTPLGAGNYTCQVFAQAAPGGTASGIVLDPGGWGDAILATEF